MSGTDWTVSTVKEYIERILYEHTTAHRAEHIATDQAVSAAFAAASKAIEKSEVATTLRFQSVNEFRGSLDDVTRRLELTLKDAVTVREFQRYVERVEAERLQDSRLRMSLIVTSTFALMTALISIVLFFAR